MAEKRKRSFASVQTVSSVAEEWDFHNLIIEMGQIIAGTSESSLGQIKVRLKMRRNYQVYLWNVVFFMMLLSGLSLCSFAVDAEDLGERLAIIITLLLTSVAYQSSVFSTLPNVPYLTLLDKYIVACFVFMCGITVETAMLNTEYLNDETHNNSMFWVSGGVFIGYHVCFMAVAIRKQFEEKKKLFMTSKAMQQMFEQSRERMEVAWNSGREMQSDWTVYTTYPDKLIVGSRTPHRKKPSFKAQMSQMTKRETDIF